MFAADSCSVCCGLRFCFCGRNLHKHGGPTDETMKWTHIYMTESLDGSSMQVYSLNSGKHAECASKHAPRVWKQTPIPFNIVWPSIDVMVSEFSKWSLVKGYLEVMRHPCESSQQHSHFGCISDFFWWHLWFRDKLVAWWCQENVWSPDWKMESNLWNAIPSSHSMYTSIPWRFYWHFLSENPKKEWDVNKCNDCSGAPSFIFETLNLFSLSAKILSFKWIAGNYMYHRGVKNI